LRFTLLEADVNFDVVKKFVADVREKALGEEVLKSLTPQQQFFAVVRDSLIELLGGGHAAIAVSPERPTIIIALGIQGSGKTTTCAKLAYHFHSKGKNPLLVPLDIRRPAAVEQLRVLATSNNLAFFFPDGGNDPVQIAREGVEKARSNNHDMVLLDTAGRLHVDDELMAEVRAVHDAVKPHETLLVLDGMTGQDAVNIAKHFDPVGVTGIVLTKMDGDTRGGAALSVRYVTGKPIKLIGIGEKIDNLEFFHPDRFVSRILGMGDLLSLIEKVEATVDMEQAKKMEQKLLKAEFNLEDFLDQIHQMRKIGPLTSLLGMIPGMGGLKQHLKDDDAEKQMRRIEAIIFSMTPGERRKPAIINSSRKKRISAGSGTTIQEINQLLKQFEWMKKMMSQMGQGRMPNLNLNQFFR
jgi:signal recognition particle subunit SRP54